MTSQQLPERPNLEQLKKQAKSLLHDARARDAAALERFRVLPIRVAEPALHDAQSVIAREYGFKSWNELRDHVEERSLSFAAAVEEFVRCATGNVAARALRLLELHPSIAHASLYTELVLGDAASVEARLVKDPGVAKQAGGVQDWEPLLYVCHTCLPERTTGLVATARALLARGANPNAEYHWNWHPELPRTALWAALCAVRHLPLAELLLEAGANPTDGVSIHITAGGGNLDALELLHRFGVNVNGIAGGVPPLRYILSWAQNDKARIAGIRWLLDHGADANLSWGEQDEAPLHLAAQRWDVPMTELLVKHGADIHRRRRDGRTAHTLAEMYGNQDIAAWLLAHGAKDELSALDRFVSACTSGYRTRAEELLKARPGLRNELRAEHHLLMQVPAERGDATVLETMLACGFDPNVGDHDGVTPLHRAAMGGRADAVSALIEGGANVNALDGMFSGTPLLWAAEGGSYNGDRQSDYVSVARQLVAAGSSREWVPPENAPNAESALEKLVDLLRVAGAQPAS